MIFFLVSAAILIALSLYLDWRNDRVYEARAELIDSIYYRQSHLINRRIPPDPHPYQALDRVSYNTMLYQFWRPIRSFLPTQTTEDHQ